MKRIILASIIAILGVFGATAVVHADPPACNVSVATLNPPAGVDLNCQPYTVDGVTFNGFDYRLL